MFSIKGLQDAATAAWNQTVATNSSQLRPSQVPLGSRKNQRARASQTMPGSLIIEEITHSDMESDVDELAERFSSITDLDRELEAAEQDTVSFEANTSGGLLMGICLGEYDMQAIEDYFTTHERLLEHEGSSSGSEDIIPSVLLNGAPLIMERTTLSRLTVQEHIELPQDVHLVAYSPIHQQHFEEYGIAWGVQWEIARLTTAYPKFSWEYVNEEDILALCGPNAGRAPSVSRILLSKSPDFADYARRERLLTLPTLLSPWDDYDEEEAYIRADRDSGLMNEHGGNVTQRMHLQITKSSAAQAVIDGLYFKFTLEQPLKSKACRFSRYLGSRRLIQCHFSDKDGRTHREAIIKFFASKKLLVNGRLFQAFYGHGSKVELMEINEDVGRAPDPIVGDHNRLALLDFIAWHNNLDLNYKQTVGKWVSRFALGFSTSLVGLTFSHNNIHFEDDTSFVREDAPGINPKKAEAHQIMTDGCGFLNWAALRAIQEKMNWEVFPVHVQARIAGAKGLFVLHPKHQDPGEEPKIWIRSSQNKVKLQAKDTWSPFHYVLDVCSGPFSQQPSSITYEMILCLSARGVSDHVLIELLRKSIQGIASDHESSSRAHGSQVLWDSIYNIHRVLQNRLRQAISPEQQRAYGFVSYTEDGEVNPEETVSAKWDVGPDPNSGTPATAQEQVLGWLQSGFSPTDPWVMEKLVYLQEKLMTAAVQVTAVENYELWSLGYHDVVVFSTKGDCHLASLLSGGDYDGDNVVLIWDEDITDQFVNSDLDAARLSDGFEEDNFDKSTDMLGDVVSRSKLQNRELEAELITALLQGAVANRLEGRYNIFYRNSVYINGLNHRDTIRLGHMFTQCLDSTKSGLVVKPSVLKRDIMRWDKRPPECFVQSRGEDESFGTKPSLRRNPGLPPFILDTLLHIAEEETRSYKARLSTRRDELARTNTTDDDLIKPFKDALDRVSRRGFGDDLKQIQSHVEKYRDLFIKARGNRGEFSPFERHGKSKKDISIGDRQESARALSEAYNCNLPNGLTLFDETAVRRVAASYAYYLDKSTRSLNFNFSFGVAWAELCAVKARATGGDFVTLASGYVDSMAIHKKIIKVYRETDSMETDSD
ncbi:hypothetical protein FRC09_010774 [Ceratobasidium sp. 395]|nr:hypothetical protein FRC09_010774 [Ceratobasidium sp. 395]